MSETPAARRGRRNPGLLRPTGEEGPEVPLTVDPDEQPEQGEPMPVLLYPGEKATLKLTIPVILEGHSREAYLGSEVEIVVQEDEDWADASARGRAFNLYTIFEQIEEAEDALRRYEEQQAARISKVLGQ